MASEEIDPRPHKNWPSVESMKAYERKNLQATLLFVDFTKAFDSIHIGKMEQILLACGLPKETIAAITILYKNTKVKVRSPDGDREYFDIVAGVLQGDTLASCSLSSAETTCLEHRSIKASSRRKKKQKVPRKNNYRRRLRRWHNDTAKYA